VQNSDVLCVIMLCQPTNHLSLPGRSLPEQCALSASSSVPSSMSMRLSVLAWRCLSSCIYQCLSCVGHYVTQMSILRLSFRLRPCFSFCACPFVCAALNVHAWSVVFRLRTACACPFVSAPAPITSRRSSIYVVCPRPMWLVEDC
jgi:hypothetical protein